MASLLYCLASNWGEWKMLMRAVEIPNSKLQIPNKFQIPIARTPMKHAGPFGFWVLDFGF
jgi:hypothetical protein